jgi:hypothetical protein
MALSAATRLIDPQRLDLGAPAAERDIKRGLADYFVESDAFTRVASGARHVVLGNRGAGKSAIFQVLAQRARASGTHVIELAPEDYSYELLSRTMLEESKGSWAKLGAYAVAWKYLLYVLVMQELARKGPRLKKGPASDIYRYVRDHHPGGLDSKLSALVSYLKRLEGIKIGKYEASIKTRELEKLYKLEEIHHLLPALREVLKRERVIIFVDELDRGWDASEDAKAFVAGLFQACMSINSLSDNLRVYMSLRQELYDNIPALYEDAQKYRDVIEVISWDRDSLLKLVAKRIKHSVRGLESKDDIYCWSGVFSRMLDRREESFSYMVERTLYRPRELIQFCTRAIEVVCDRRASLPVNKAIVSEAELRHSEERTKDIAAEYRFQFPGLLGVFEVFRGRERSFDRDKLSMLCLEVATGTIPTSKAASWIQDCDPDSLIEILWQVGFLRAAAASGMPSSGHDSGSYLGSYQVANLNLLNIQEFQVHPMFWAYLGLPPDAAI